MKREIDVSFLVKRDLLSSHWQLFSVITRKTTTAFFFSLFLGNVKKPSSKLENIELVEGVLRSKLPASPSLKSRFPSLFCWLPPFCFFIVVKINLFVLFTPNFGFINWVDKVDWPP